MSVPGSSRTTTSQVDERCSTDIPVPLGLRSWGYSAPRSAGLSVHPRCARRLGLRKCSPEDPGGAEQGRPFEAASGPVAQVMASRFAGELHSDGETLPGPSEAEAPADLGSSVPASEAPSPEDDLQAPREQVEGSEEPFKDAVSTKAESRENSLLCWPDDTLCCHRPQKPVPRNTCLSLRFPLLELLTISRSILRFFINYYCIDLIL